MHRSQHNYFGACIRLHVTREGHHNWSATPDAHAVLVEQLTAVADGLEQGRRSDIRRRLWVVQNIRQSVARHAKC